MRLKPIHQQVVVLFGATSGIGLETALHLIEKGAQVAVVGRDQASVLQAVERVRQHARAAREMELARQYTGAEIDLRMDEPVDQQVEGFVADAAQWDQVKGAADQIAARFGRIDSWVHLAAVSQWSTFEDTSPEEFRRVIEVNLTGMAYGAMAALPYLKRQDQGVLIFVSAAAGRVPMPYQSAYSASKHGIIALVSSLRMELEHEGYPISVTTILPSSINTPIYNKARTKLGVEPRPIPPVYDPALVAQAILYAAQHPVKEIPMDGSGWAIQLMRRVSPPLGERMIRSSAFKSQRSDEVKSVQAPDNLFEHVSGYDRVEGGYETEMRRFSPQLWLTMHPAARILLQAAMLIGLAFLAFRVIRGRREPSLWDRARFWERPAFRRQAQKISRSLPMRRQKPWWENLAGLPLIGLLPLFARPNLRKRIQTRMQKIPRQTEKMMRRMQRHAPTQRRTAQRLPIERVRSEIVRVQEKLPGGNKETFLGKVQEKIEVRQKNRLPIGR